MGLSQVGLVLRPCFTFLVLVVVSNVSQSTTIRNHILASIIGVSVLHSLTTHALATGLTTQTTGAVAAQEQGALLGLEHGLFSLARIGGPTIGTFVFIQFSFAHVAMACGVLDCLLLALLMKTSARIAGGQKAKGR